MQRFLFNEWCLVYKHGYFIMCMPDSKPSIEENLVNDVKCIDGKIV